MTVTLVAVARSLDTPEELAPYLAEVFAPLSSLGGQPRTIVAMLRRAGIGSRSRVLDLACGKGASGIAAARALGCRVHGVDGYAPFIEEAKRAAARAGVSALCRFEVGDAGRFEKRPPRERFDAAMMVSLWPLQRAARALRVLVKPGGVYIIDDAVVMPGAPRRYRESGLLTRAEVHERIESFGDAIVRESVWTVAMARRSEARLQARLTKRCAALAREHPELRGPLRRFLTQQRESAKVLCGPLRPGVWMVRRGKMTARNAGAST